jgi:hypothetical protein
MSGKAAEVVRKNAFHHVILFVCACIVTAGRAHPGVVLANVMAAQLFFYATHYALHAKPAWMHAYDVHVRFHHGRAKADRTVASDVLTEFAVPMAVVAAGILAVRALGLQAWMPPAIYVLWGLVYTTVHLVEYTWLESCHQDLHVMHHAAHHEHKICNLGPDWLDHAFGTSCDGTVEDARFVAVHAVAATILMTVFRHGLPGTEPR